MSSPGPTLRLRRLQRGVADAAASLEEVTDYVNHTVHKNKHTAHYAQSGRVRIVVAHSDPGHPNWIETAGHHNGTMCWRWIGASEHPDIEATVMKHDEFVAQQAT